MQAYEVVNPLLSKKKTPAQPSVDIVQAGAIPRRNTNNALDNITSDAPNVETDSDVDTRILDNRKRRKRQVSNCQPF